MPILGIDVGASKIYYVVLDGENRLLEGEFKIKEQTREAFLDLCRSISEQIKAKGLVIERAGVGIPGTLKDGIATNVANFPTLEGLDISSELQKIFAVPIKVVNDAKAFTFAEATLGAGRGFKNLVGLTLGSGLGGGIMINGEIYRGRGNAGEIGHLAWFDGSQEVEDYVSAKFFKEDVEQVRKEAENGDLSAQDAFRELGKNLGVVMANLVNLLDSEAIILGGGITGAYNLFIDPAKERARQLIVSPESKDVQILKTALGPAAGAIGAALLAKIE